MRVTVAVLAMVVGLAVVTSSAVASGPLPPGKVKNQSIFTAVCAGVGTFTLAANLGDGAAQFVDANGHLIPVVFDFQVLDHSSGALLSSDPNAIGNGNAHPNQQTTTCTVPLFSGAAGDFFGPDLPPGVSPTMIVDVQLVVTAIIVQP